MNQNTFLKLAAGLLLAGITLTSCLKDYENPASGTNGPLTTIFALRQAYQGSEVTLDENALGGASRIQGVVISDKAGKNIEDNSFVLQQTVVTANPVADITRGIVIRMASAPAVNTGDSLLVNVSGMKLSRVNGNLTISGVTADRISQLATGRVPYSRPVTQGILQSRMDEFESTLVTINADVVGAAAGTTYSGLRQLNDNTGPAVYVRTLTGALHAGATVPADAQFGGIAGFYNESGSDSAGAQKIIMPRNAADIQFASGVLYSGFPESFENPDAATKSSYNSGTNIVALGTGSWTLLQAILANTAGSDKYNIPGRQGIRMQQNLTTNGFVQMNFDVSEGASKVTVFYGRYGTDAKSTLRLEYSTNAGTTWTAVGANVTDMPDKGMKQAVWTVNLTGAVRFRINKLGTGTSNNGRLNLDDLAIYKKL